MAVKLISMGGTTNPVCDNDDDDDVCPTKRCALK